MLSSGCIKGWPFLEYVPTMWERETGDGPWPTGVVGRFLQEFVIYALPTPKSDQTLSTLRKTWKLVR